MEQYDVMIELLRSSVLDRIPDIPSDTKIDWDNLMNLASGQCLLAWIWDGIKKLPKELQPSRIEMISWGLSTQEIWDDYEKKKRVLSQIIEKCSKENIRVLLLKGIALSLLYPQPKSRPSGDIDIFLLDGQYDRGNNLLFQDKYSFGGKHSFSPIDDVMVENHVSIIDTYTRLQHKIEKYLESGLKDAILMPDGYWIQSPQYHLIHLLVHTLSHIDYYSLYPLPIRNVLDFGMFLKVNENKIDCGELNRVLLKYKLEKSFGLILHTAEEILAIEFPMFHFNDVHSQDIKKLLNIIYSRDITPLPTQNESYFKQIKKRYSHYKRVRWLHKYLPYSNAEFVHSVIKREINFLVKRIIGIPSSSSLKEFVLNMNH